MYNKKRNDLVIFSLNARARVCVCVCVRAQIYISFIVLKKDILQKIIEMIRLKKNKYFIKKYFYSISCISFLNDRILYYWYSFDSCIQIGRDKIIWLLYKGLFNIYENRFSLKNFIILYKIEVFYAMLALFFLHLFILL